jgi:hypothetical protein
LPTTTTEEVNKMADRVYIFCKWIASWLQQTNNLIWWCKKHNCSYKFHWEQQHHRWLHCWFLLLLFLYQVFFFFFFCFCRMLKREMLVCSWVLVVNLFLTNCLDLCLC